MRNRGKLFYLRNVLSVLGNLRISGLLKYASLLIIVSTFAFLVVFVYSYGAGNPVNSKDSIQADSIIDPFELVKNRIVPGSIFQAKVDKKLFDEKQDKIIEIALEYEISPEGKKKLSPISKYFFKHVNDDLFLFAEMPSWNKIGEIKKQSAWRGWLASYKAYIKISYQKAEKRTDLDYPVEIPYVLWAYIWGILAVIVSFFIISLLKPEPLKEQGEFEEDTSKTQWEGSNKVKRFFLYPLNFSITPLGTYSISVTQILLWTYVTMFGIVYVYWLSGAFLEITPQILMLLGIGGGTALGAKINALSRIHTLPPKYLKLVKKTRTPKLKDLISIGGQPNIFKFQILAFTLLTGYIVIVEIAKNHCFPTIPDSLITMMGISSAVYLGNEIAHKNVWDEIKKKQKEIEDHASKNNIPIKDAKELLASKIPQVEELKSILNDIYSV